MPAIDRPRSCIVYVCRRFIDLSLIADPHPGRFPDTGTHYDAMQRKTCPALQPVAATSYPLSWPQGYAAKRPIRGSVRLRIEPEPVILCAYAVLKRVVCREEFDATSATLSTLEPGQLVLTSEVREAAHGGKRVRLSRPFCIVFRLL